MSNSTVTSKRLYADGYMRKEPEQSTKKPVEPKEKRKDPLEKLFY